MVTTAAWMVLAGVMVFVLIATMWIASSIKAMHEDVFMWLRSIDEKMKTRQDSAVLNSKSADRDESPVVKLASELSSINVTLGRLCHLGGSRPYSLDDLALLRARCHYMWWRIKRNDQLSGDVRWRVLAEDEAQYSFLYRYLTLAMAANQRVAAGIENIPEAIARVESEKGDSPFDGSEGGNMASTWDIVALRECLVSYGLNMDLPAPPVFR